MVPIFSWSVLRNGKSLVHHSVTSNDHHQLGIWDLEAADTHQLRNYWPNLKLSWHGRFVNGKPQGEILTHDEEGHKHELNTHFNGVKHGKFIRYHRSGQP